ncbi:MAG: peptidoglycan-binding protein [Alphaproteobacteria bacterium]
MSLSSLEPCPNCEQSISTAAKACPHCGHPLDTEVWANARSRKVANINPQYETGAKAKKSGCSPVAALIVGGLTLVIFIASRNDAPNQLERDCNDSGLAYIYSQDVAREHLRAPRTADFPNKSNVFIKNLGDCRHLVLAHVDAENAFGAKLRNFYTVAMTFNKATERFDANPLTFHISSERSNMAAFAALTEVNLTKSSHLLPASEASLSERDIVTRIQQKLARLGYDVGAADGVAGNRTKAAIEAHQRKLGIAITGKADRAFLDQLK